MSGRNEASADTLGALDPDAVARVREEAWPQPESAEEVHEALLWMGYASASEVEDSGWREWIDELEGELRVVREGDVAAGDPIERTTPSSSGPTIAEIVHERLEEEAGGE